MLSFGTEYERALSMAFWRARFALGSGPPSRAATMIARESFEKSWPRLASATPFLCLIDDHLLCPDIGVLLLGLEKELVHACVVGQLRVEGSRQEPARLHQDGLTVVLGQDLDLGPSVLDARGANEDPAQAPRRRSEVEIGLEARNLPAMRNCAAPRGRAGRGALGRA